MHLEAVAHAHAAAFIGRTPWDVAGDAALLADAHATAWRCYGNRLVTPRVLTYGAEAAAWGQKFASSNGNEHEDAIPLAPLFARAEEIESLPALDPRTPALVRLLDAGRTLTTCVQATVAIPVTGPMALVETLLGTDVARYAMARDPQAFATLLLSLVQRLRPWIEAIGAASLSVAIHESDFDPRVTSPDVFERTLLPALTELTAAAHASTGLATALFIDGDTAKISSLMGQSGAGYINCPETTAQTAFLAGLKRFPEVTVRVDLPRHIWLQGDWHTVCGELAARAGVARWHERTVLGTGPLPLHASSVLVVDACNYATNLDAWLDSV